MLTKLALSPLFAPVLQSIILGILTAAFMSLRKYLATHAKTLKVATLVRRLAAISVAHEAAGLASPVRSPLVRATMRGIRRERGTAQRQAKPLLGTIYSPCWRPRGSP